MATEIEVLSVLKILGDVYPSYKLTSSAIELYVRLLADIQARILERSALDHISRSSFFPTIAELRQSAFKLIESADPLPLEYEAWSEVQAEVRRVGYYGEPHFSHPIISKVVEQLDWRNLCQSDNQVSDRAHFVQAFRAAAELDSSSSRRLPVVTEFIAEVKTGQYPRLASGEQE